MKLKAISLVFVIVLNCMIISGCPSDSESGASSNGPTSIQSQVTISTPYTTLAAPFNGNGEWYLVQAFGARYSAKNNANHSGEDWNFVDDDNKPIYAIAPGEIVENKLVYPGDEAYGYYVIVKHTGRFKIPASTEPHLYAASNLSFLNGYGSNDAKKFVNAKEVFFSTLTINNQFSKEQKYQYPAEEVTTLYSVYMHLNENKALTKGTKIIDITKQIGSLRPSVAGKHAAHLHLEIRHPFIEKQQSNTGYISVMGQSNLYFQGYFYDSQMMVDLGYREPSSVIQANSGQTIAIGQVLGTETDPIVTSTLQGTANALPQQSKSSTGKTSNKEPSVDNYNQIVSQYSKYQRVISAGFTSTIGIKKDGTVVGVGQLGRYICDVTSWNDIVAVSTGDWQAIGLKSNGTVVVTPKYSNMQSNISTWAGIVDISSGGLHIVGLKSDGTVVAVGDISGGCDVSGWKDITAIAAGEYHSVGLKKDGTAVAVGQNNKDTRCQVSDWNDLIAIDAGSKHTVGLKKDGTVIAVGNNFDGQCNVSAWKDIIMIAAGTYHTVGLKKDGTVVATGHSGNGRTEVRSWTDIIAISAGYHTIGLKKDGTMIAIGNKDKGQCDVFAWTDLKIK